MSCPGNSQGDCFAADWARRVQNNGGARPSQATIDAAGVFWNALETAGIRSKMKALNFFAPDNLTAAITPLIKGTGKDPWTNNGPIVSGDLTVNGLVGNGSSKYLQTGLTPSVLWPVNTSPTEGGLSLYNSTSSNTGADIGALVGGNDFYLTPGSVGNITFEAYHNNPGEETINVAGNWTGFLSGNRTTPSAAAMYKASGAVPFVSIGTAAGGSHNGSQCNVEILCHAVWLGGAPGAFSDKRLSFAAVHDGLNATEAEALYNAVQALRTALGGGFV